MGAADDLKKGLTKNLANFTKQRKAEEKHSSAGRWRTSRMIEVRGKFLIEAANEVMEECYMKASDNNRLPATARQIYYVARPLIEDQSSCKSIRRGVIDRRFQSVRGEPLLCADTTPACEIRDEHRR